MTTDRDRNTLLALLGTFAVVFVWSAIAPKDRLTWFLETAPAVIGIVVLAATYTPFRFTHFAYAMMTMHAVILMVGGHYTYAEVPLFDWVRDTFGLVRNDYDRLGHIAQGFFPALVAREILLRRSPLRPGKWLFFLVTCVCLAISAFYELIEWWVALATGDNATAFLATQGDPWDTQWDMFSALCGALAAQTLLAAHHDRALAALTVPTVQAARATRRTSGARASSKAKNRLTKATHSTPKGRYPA